MWAFSDLIAQTLDSSDPRNRFVHITEGEEGYHNCSSNMFASID